VHPDFRSHKTGGSTIPKLWHALRRNDDFMMRFADRAYQHLCHDGVLTDQNAQTRWLALNESIREAVVAESARWGDAMEPHGQPTRTRDLDWQREVDAIYHMIDGTSGMFLDNLRAEGYYPQIDPPVFSQRGGQVDDGFELALMIPNSSGLIWYTLDGSDPRTPGQSEGTSGIRQRHPVDGPIAAGAMAYAGLIPVEKAVRVRARVLDGATWSAIEETTFTPRSVAQGLRITEIMYHPADPNAEFIELYNIGNTAINIQFVQLTEGVSFTCPDVMLAAGECALVVADVEAFEFRYGQGFPVLGPYAGRLSNSGERLVLTDAAGQTILDFAYDDDWFDATDGRDYSLVVTDPTLDTSLWSHEASWGPSALSGGSPGTN